MARGMEDTIVQTPQNTIITKVGAKDMSLILGRKQTKMKKRWLASWQDLSHSPSHIYAAFFFF